MHIATQFSIFMINKPGVLSKVLNEFANAKLNLLAMTMMDSAEHGVMRAVFTRTSQARDILKKLNMPFSETDVLCITLANKSGALADLAEKLARSHINISYAYCTAGARGGRTTGIIKVADVKKATKLMQGKGVKKKQAKPSLRKPSTARK
jgi:hypothetical protein